MASKKKLVLGDIIISADDEVFLIGDRETEHPTMYARGGELKLVDRAGVFTSPTHYTLHDAEKYVGNIKDIMEIIRRRFV